MRGDLALQELVREGWYRERTLPTTPATRQWIFVKHPPRKHAHYFNQLFADAIRWVNSPNTAFNYQVTCGGSPSELIFEERRKTTGS